MPKKKAIGNGNFDDRMEKEADCFATCLLIPRLLVEKFRLHYSDSDLSDMFHVSHDLMKERLKEVL